MMKLSTYSFVRSSLAFVVVRWRWLELLPVVVVILLVVAEWQIVVVILVWVVVVVIIIGMIKSALGVN